MDYCELDELEWFELSIEWLDKLAADVLRMRLGLAPFDGPRTIVETGEALGLLSRDVLRIEMRAMADIARFAA